MNKILLDGEVLVLTDGNFEITIKGKSVINIPNNKNEINLKLNLEDHADLEVNDYNLENKCTNIEVIHNNNSVFNYFHTFKVNGKYQFNYKAIIKGDNNINNIHISGISNGEVIMDVDGIISANSKENEINENIKVLTIEGNAFVSPMLHVNAENCIVNHNTAISNIREDELFYLMSKGISKKSCIKLIENGYLYGLFKNNDEFFKIIMGGDTIE